MTSRTLPLRPADEDAPLPLAILAAIGVVLIGCTAYAVLLLRDHAISDYVWLMALHGAFYLAAVFVVWQRGGTMPGHPEAFVFTALIVLTGIALRLVAMMAPPALTTDAYRYVWDGRLLLEGVSPYLYVPADPALEAFRDASIYPNINKKDVAHTIYPPGAQVLFAAGVWVDTTLAGQKFVMFVCEIMTMGFLIGWLRAGALPSALVVIYAWHPLPIWEFSSQAHLDAAVTAAVAAGVWAASVHRQGLAGLVLAIAFLIKYFPLALTPAIWRRWDWRAPVIFVAVVAAAYLPFAMTAGPRVIGYLGDHLDNEGYGAGWGFHVIWFFRDFGLADPSRDVYLAAALMCLAGVAAFTLFGRGRDEHRPGHIALLGAAFVFFTSPHYPWYFGFLVALMVRAPHPALFVMTLGAIGLQMPRPPGGPTWTELYFFAYWLPLLIWLGGLVLHSRGWLPHWTVLRAKARDTTGGQPG